MILRLHEEGYMDAETVHEFLKVELEVLQKAIAYEPGAARWYKRTPEIVRCQISDSFWIRIRSMS